MFWGVDKGTRLLLCRLELGMELTWLVTKGAILPLMLLVPNCWLPCKGIMLLVPNCCCDGIILLVLEKGLILAHGVPTLLPGIILDV